MYWKITVSVLAFAVAFPGCSIGKTMSGRHDESSDPLLLQSQQSYLAGNYSQAVETLTASLGRLPAEEQPEAYMWRGKSYLAMGQWSQAGADFHQGLQLTEDPWLTGQCAEGYGDCLRAQENYPQAITYYHQALTAAEGQVDEGSIHYKIGLSYIRAGDWSQGRQAMRVVTGEFPNSRYADQAKRFLDHLGNYFAIQVASFSTQSAAMREEERIELTGHDARISRQQTGQYALLVGRYRAWKEAQQNLDGLRRLYADAFIIP